MGKWGNLNMPLRCFILQHAIRQEQTSADVIKALLRILKPKTKTLGNKSSSMSFKMKIDLLHDIGELNEQEYNNLIKFMEIRNQFIHNHEVNSFLALGDANNELLAFLRKTFPNSEPDAEKSLLMSYNKLFIHCQGKLLVLEHEFIKGIETDLKKHVDHQVMEQFDEILEQARGNYIEQHQDLPILQIGGDNITEFVTSLKLAISQNRLQALKAMTPDLKEAFQRKVPLDSSDSKAQKEPKEKKDK